MLRQSEKEWGKQYGLRKTKLIYYKYTGYTGSKRVVYEATRGERIGQLFIINDSSYNLVSREDCFNPEQKQSYILGIMLKCPDGDKEYCHLNLLPEDEAAIYKILEKYDDDENSLRGNLRVEDFTGV